MNRLLAAALFSLLAAPLSAQLTAQQKQQLLDLHNLERCNVNPTASSMPAMVWDVRLEQVAQDYANSCPPLGVHNPNRVTQYQMLGGPESSVGENLAFSTFALSVDVYFDLWADEKVHYNFAANTCAVEPCGHYTQIVWATSTKVGCGFSFCPARTEFPYMLVCNYAPAGNFIGQRPYTQGNGVNAACGPQPAGSVRTWVATEGLDTNPCTRTSPCRNFAAAAAQTNPDGEVVVLNSGGYGAVTLTESVSIISPAGVHAAIAPTSGNAITINAGPEDTVVLRGLYLNAQGGGTGIRLNSAGALHLENLVISGFSQYGADLVDGCELLISDSVFRHNNAGLSMSGGGGGHTGMIERSHFERSVGYAMGLFSGGEVSVRDTVATRNEVGFIALGAGNHLIVDRSASTSNIVGVSAQSSSRLTITRSVVAFNGTALHAAFAGTVYLGNNTVVQNSEATAVAIGGEIITLGGNRIAGNGTPAVFQGSIPPE